MIQGCHADVSASLQNVDLVIEGTGVFVNSEGAGKHLQAGAKKVLLQPSFSHCMTIIDTTVWTVRLLTLPHVQSKAIVCGVTA